MLSLFLEGAVLGLSTGAYCLASCLPALAPYMLAGGDSWKNNFIIFLEFIAGRFLAYMLFALGAIWLGKVSSPYLPAKALATGMLATSLFMFYFLLAGRLKTRFSCLASFPALWAEKKIPFALGFFTGINICPPFVAGLLRLTQLSDAFKGLIYYAGFFLTTSLFLLPALAATPFLNSRLKQIGRMTLFLAALWYLILALSGLTN